MLPRASSGYTEESGVVEVGDAVYALVYTDYQVIEGDGVVGGDQPAEGGGGELQEFTR